MGLKYAIFHASIHFLLPVAIAYFLRLDFFQFIIVLIGSIIIDLDHLPLLKKHGIGGLFYLRAVQEFGKPRRYTFHNFVTLVIFSLGSFLFLQPGLYMLGIFSLSIALHLLWDFFEDVAIFRMSIKHWKV